MGRNNRHRRHANPFNIRQAPAHGDWELVFGRRAPLEVEVGFGRGLFLLGLAAARLDHDFVGLEIRDHLVDNLHIDRDSAGLSNVAGLLCNANFHLEGMFAEASVSAFYVQFPDPWFKKRHHKRRVIQPQLIDTMALQLVDGGALNIVTDQAPMAEHVLEVMGASTAFVNLDGAGQRAPDDACFGPVATDREAWHLGRGDPVYRFRFRRMSR